LHALHNAGTTVSAGPNRYHASTQLPRKTEHQLHSLNL